MFLRLFFLSAALAVFARPVLAADCRRFVEDFSEGGAFSSKTYQLDPKEIYIPAAYCPYPVLTPVSEQPGRTELYFVEQCRETGYKTLKTTLLCVGGLKKAVIRASCDIDGRTLAPCLKNELTGIIPQG